MIPAPDATIEDGVGATLSKVKVMLLAGPVLPAASVAVTATVFEPCDSPDVGVMEKLPEPFAVPVPTVLPLTVSVTVAPASAVPLMVASLVTLSPATPVSLASASEAGAFGAAVSIRRCRAGCRRSRR